jgi:hypothetical protein
MNTDYRSPLERRLEDRGLSRGNGLVRDTCGCDGESDSEGTYYYQCAMHKLCDRGERLLWHWHRLRREEALTRARTLYACEPCTVEEFRARERLDEFAGVPHGLNYDDADLADWAWSRVCEENGFRWKRAFRVTEEQRGEIGL